MDTSSHDPGVEVAPLPRERLGPFLILGVPKDATAEQIEAAWAQRVLWARQGKSAVSLGDIHWAREVLRDPARRVAADAASLNVDIVGDELRRLGRLYGLDPERPTWQPVDPEPPAEVAAAIPDVAQLRAEMPAPSVPIELPGVGQYLKDVANEKIDPWTLTMPAAEKAARGGNE